MDSGGNVYAAGYIQGSEEFDFETWSFGGGGEGRNPSDLYDVDLVKLDSSGVPQWKQTFSGGSSSPQFEAVAVDSRGNVFAAGVISGKATNDFGGSSASGSSEGDNVLLVKYDSTERLNGRRASARELPIRSSSQWRSTLPAPCTLPV